MTSAIAAKSLSSEKLGGKPMMTFIESSSYRAGSACDSFPTRLSVKSSAEGMRRA
jgi:hypothetical protein